ncbi:fiber 4 [White sturgeon adenovirus 1]|uniref:Fiber 4 n=1 Tax=White sturgeon adenovirus 1 TaxID=2580388 RepID=A0A4P8PIN8_9ADEN|nr:fiber 4 [White sturgeon adenovirus 1]QCQ84148.1 fiber 4 [White sturgeon adenovirus 1]
MATPMKRPYLSAESGDALRTPYHGMVDTTRPNFADCPTPDSVNCFRGLTVKDNQLTLNIDPHTLGFNNLGQLAVIGVDKNGLNTPGLNPGSGVGGGGGGPLPDDNLPPPEVDLTPPQKYYVITIAGGANCVGYGTSGYNFLDPINRPHSRIKQLGRFNQTLNMDAVADIGGYSRYVDDISTGYGTAINHFRSQIGNLAVLPATPCLDHAQNMFYELFHDGAQSGGSVGFGLAMAKRLLPFLPADYDILLVPCAYGNTNFSNMNNQVFDELTLDIIGISKEPGNWKANNPLAQQCLARTEFALNMNPHNMFCCMIWSEDITDISETAETHYLELQKFIESFNNMFSGRVDDLLTQGIPKWIVLSPGRQQFYPVVTNSKLWQEDYARRPTESRSETLCTKLSAYITLGQMYNITYIDCSVVPDGSLIDLNRSVADTGLDAFYGDYFSTKSQLTIIAKNIADVIIQDILLGESPETFWLSTLPLSNPYYGYAHYKKAIGEVDFFLNGVQSLKYWQDFTGKIEGFDFTSNLVTPTEGKPTIVKETPNNHTLTMYVGTLNGFSKQSLRMGLLDDDAIPTEIPEDSLLSDYIKLTFTTPDVYDSFTFFCVCKPITYLQNGSAVTLASIVGKALECQLIMIQNEAIKVVAASSSSSEEFTEVATFYGIEACGPLTNKWMSVAFSWDNDYLTLFVNGCLIEKIQCSFDFSGTEIESLYIGVDSTKVGSQPFQGLISELRVYKEPLSASEVRNLHTMTCVPYVTY